jgi:hypothetical protein
VVVVIVKEETPHAVKINNGSINRIFFIVRPPESLLTTALPLMGQT